MLTMYHKKVRRVIYAQDFIPQNLRFTPRTVLKKELANTNSFFV